MTTPAYTPDNVDAVDDQFMLALCLWREARGELAAAGPLAYIAIGCVLRNRSRRDTTSIYEEVIKRFAFTSVTDHADPETTLFPTKRDPSQYGAWLTAHQIAGGILAGHFSDPTRGATLYYASSIPFPPDWDRSKVTQTATIGKHNFLLEHA